MTNKRQKRDVTCVCTIKAVDSFPYSTELWFNCNENNDSYINALLPKGYAIQHLDRHSGKRDGAVALINKKSLKLKYFDIVIYEKFESIMSTLTINNTSFII